MKTKTSEPHIPDEILEKTRYLKKLLDQASNVYDEIIDWYDKELKTYDPEADATHELYDPGTGIVVKYISCDSMLEGISILQTFNETNGKRD